MKLGNLFKDLDSVRRVGVIQIVTPDGYVLEDASGNKFKAVATGTYLPKETVLVIGGVVQHKVNARKSEVVSV